MYVEIRVTDTGKGIAPDNELKIFEPFFTTKPVGQGSGLGLSMVKGFAAQSGGLLQLISGKAGATTFSLILPAKSAETQAIIASA